MMSDGLPDLGFSGFARCSFGEAVSILFEVARSWPARELILWDRSGAGNRSVFHPGSQLDDALSVLHFDPDSLSRLTCHVGVHSPELTSSMALALVDLGHGAAITGIEGQLHWSQDDAQEHAQLLDQELESLVGAFVRKTKGLIAVSDEDDESLVVSEVPFVSIPTVMAATHGDIPREVKAAIESTGGRVRNVDGVSIARLGRATSLDRNLRRKLTSWLSAEVSPLVLP